MSRHWRILKTSVIGAPLKGVDEILAKLAKTCPQEIPKLQAINWHKLRKYIAGLALKKVAKQLKCTVFSENKVNNWEGVNGIQPKGECIGSVQVGKYVVGVFVSENQTTLGWVDTYYASNSQLSTAQTRAGSPGMPQEIREFQQQLERALRIEGIYSALRILYGDENIEIDTGRNGVVRFGIRRVGGA